MEIVDKCINALTKPVETFKKEKKKANLMEGIKLILIGSFIAGIFGGISSYINLSSLNAQMGGISSAMLVGVFIGNLILNPIFAIIFSLILGGMIFIMAKLLGGKGEFGVHFGLMALVMAPMFLLSNALNIVPFVGGILSILVTLYVLYPLTISVKEAYGLDTVKAVVSWLVPVVILIVTMVVFAAIIAVLIGAAMYTGA